MYVRTYIDSLLFMVCSQVLGKVAVFIYFYACIQCTYVATYVNLFVVTSSSDSTLISTTAYEHTILSDLLDYIFLEYYYTFLKVLSITYWSITSIV